MYSPSKSNFKQISSQINHQFNLSGFNLTKSALNHLTNYLISRTISKNTNARDTTSKNLLIDQLIDLFGNFSSTTISLDDVRQRISILSSSKSSIEAISIIPSIVPKSYIIKKRYYFILERLKRQKIKTQSINQLFSLISQHEGNNKEEKIKIEEGRISSENEEKNTKTHSEKTDKQNESYEMNSENNVKIFGLLKLKYSKDRNIRSNSNSNFENEKIDNDNNNNSNNKQNFNVVKGVNFYLEDFTGEVNLDLSELKQSENAFVLENMFIICEGIPFIETKSNHNYNTKVENKKYNEKGEIWLKVLNIKSGFSEKRKESLQNFEKIRNSKEVKRFMECKFFVNEKKTIRTNFLDYLVNKNRKEKLSGFEDSYLSSKELRVGGDNSGEKKQESNSESEEELMLFFGDVNIRTDINKLSFVIFTIFISNLNFDSLYNCPSNDNNINDNEIEKELENVLKFGNNRVGLTNVFVSLGNCNENESDNDNNSLEKEKFDSKFFENYIYERILYFMRKKISNETISFDDHNNISNKSEIKNKTKIEKLKKLLKMFFVTKENKKCFRVLVNKVYKDFKNEIVIYNFGVLKKLIEKSIISVKLKKTDFQKQLAKVLLEQNNLNFFEKCFSHFDCCNFLFPLPNLLVLGEKNEKPFKFVFGDTMICNMGSFRRRGEFLLYYLNKNEIDISEYNI